MKKILKIFFIIILIMIFLMLAGICAFTIYARAGVDFELDEALFLEAKANNKISFFYDSSGSDSLSDYEPILYEEYNFSGEEQKWYSYDEFSPYLISGFIAMEDRGYFSHHGVDLKRSLAAAVNYIFKGDKSFGGSTITQQVIKNISGDNEKTVKRKLDEMIRAYQVEFRHSKKEVLELYLNIIPMSENIIGAGLAAERFFGKSPGELTAAEAATIIAIANAPTRYNPYRNPTQSLEKRNKVLYVMKTEGVISEKEYEAAKKFALSLKPKESFSKNVRSWFAETVLNDVISDLMKKKNCSYEAAKLFLYKNGASIYTTIDPEVQRILDEYFENTDNFPEEISNGLEYSMVVCDENNLLRGIAGAVGRKKLNGGYNNALTLRAPGSAIKPIALYLPLINERKITWSTVFDDSPVNFTKNSDGGYTEFPKNSNQKYDGLTTVYDAVRQSKNTVAVRLYNILGAEKIYKYLKDKFGFDTLVYSEKTENGSITDLAPSPLALGQLTRGVSLRKLTEAYNVFSGEGEINKGRSYLFVFDTDGELLIENKSEVRRVSDSLSARAMTKILEGVVDSGTASSIRLKSIYPTAGKTGTSGNNKDKIFVGYTPYYTAGVWCGYTDSSESVGNYRKNHLTVWDEVMALIHEKCVGYSEEREFSTGGLLYMSYCKDSGKLFSEACIYDPRGDRMEYGYFIKGSEPQQECDRHILLYENLFPFLRRISLLRPEVRSFPKELKIADEKYMYENKRGKNNRP